MPSRCKSKVVSRSDNTPVRDLLVSHLKYNIHGLQTNMILYNLFQNHNSVVFEKSQRSAFLSQPDTFVMSVMHLSMCGGDTLGIRPTKSHFPREFDGTL